PWIGGIERLIRQNRHILRYVMSKRNAEYTDIVRPAVSGPNHRVLRNLIGKSQTRREVGQAGCYISIQPNAVLSRDPHLSGGNALECAVIVAIDILREIDFP